MEKIFVVFDSFKDAFHINKGNKNLYRPQLLLIIVKLLLIIGIGLKVYSWIGNTAFRYMGLEQMIWFVVKHGIALFFLMLLYGIVSVVIESGLYNMYKNCILKGSSTNGDFKYGIKKYFGNFLLGYLLIALFWIITSPLYVILGLLTLTLGFTLIPIILSLFLTMWKVSMVMNDISLFQAVKDSFIFVKKNFLPVTVLQLIHWSFVKTASSSASFSNAINYKTNSNEIPMDGGSIFSSRLFQYDLIKILKIAVAILIPVITIASLISFLVKMIFEVFFSLSLFTLYNRLYIRNNAIVREGTL